MNTLYCQTIAASLALATLLTATPSAAAISFAVVNTDGTVASGSSDLQSVTHLGIGQYEATFSGAVNTCAYVATTLNTYTQAIQATTAGGHLDAQRGVYVETKNQGGGLIEGAFSLAVICGSSAGTQYAVVGYTANLVRSSPGATLTNVGNGQYNVTFARNVGACAYIATEGDPGNGVVFSPSGVFTGSGPDTSTVYVETKNPGGGLQNGIPFHLAAICPDAPQANVLVVKQGGFPQRGSALTSSYESSTGEYTISTSVDVSACATVATRGSVDTSVPFSPSTVEVVPGPAINTTAIELRNLLGFGGALDDQAFHLAIACGP